MMANNNEGVYSFKQLIEQYVIEIPEIQRDYVQGQDDGKAIAIRQKLSRDLLSDREVYLFFIYGQVCNGMFIPLDGQQRLTTLFLLHWYLSVINDKANEFYDLVMRDGKCHFLHESHPDNTDFICYLLDYSIEDNHLATEMKAEKPSDLIKGSFDFKHEWNRNPTIVNMLNTLDSFNEIESSRTYDDLDKIVFHFLKIDELKDADGDYIFIKMNSTGKTLTKWELFKADIFREMKPYANDELFSKVENDYMDACFRLLHFNSSSKHSIADISPTEKIAMNLMQVIMLVFLSLNNEDSVVKGISSTSELFSVMNNRWKEFAEVLNGYIDVLFNNLNRHNSSVCEANRFQSLVQTAVDSLSNDKFDFAKEYQIRTIVASLISDNHPSWYFRVVYNLLANANQQQEDTVFNAIRGLAKIKDINTLPQSGFIPATVVLEESLKLELIEKNDEWRALIEQAEQNQYLDGSTAMILSAIKPDWIHCDFTSFSIPEFEKYSSLVVQLLSADKTRNLYAIERYMILNATKSVFYEKHTWHPTSSMRTDNQRDTSFKRVFLDFNNTESANFRDYFYRVCNDSDPYINEKLDVPTDSKVIEVIINYYEDFMLCLSAYPRKAGVPIWQYCLARNLRFFDYGSSDYFFWQSDARIIRYYEDSQPYIYYPLRRQYISGWHTEVFVDYICQQNIKGINLREEATENNSPFAEICIGDELVAVMYTSAPGWVFNNIPSKFSECKSFNTTNFSQFTVTDNNSSFICLVNKDNTDGIRLDPEYIDEIIEELQSVLNNATN